MAMKQAKNEVFIEGILLESDIVTDVTKKDNKSFIRGEVKIQVTQKFGNEEVDSIIPVRMFAMQTTKEGKPNSAYDSILKIRDTFTSAAAAGSLEGADAVRISRGSIGENIFVPKGSDKEVSFPEIQSNFLNKVNRAQLAPVTRFSINVAVNSIKEETKGGEPTGALILKGGIVQYNEKLDLVDFKIYNDAAKNFIQNTYAIGDTVNIQGFVNFSAKTEYVDEEAGFGESISVPKTTTVRELIITTGSVEPFDEERAYLKEDLNKALAARMGRVAQLKETPKATPAPSQSGALGF